LKVIALWGPVLLVMALIFTASSMSDPGTPPGGLSDKGAHLVAYGALGASLVRALSGNRSAGMTVRRILLAAVLATLYGVTDELHQSFVPQRTPDVLDLAADASGGLAGSAALAAAAKLVAVAAARGRRDLPPRPSA
jgi:VanZ family protein